MVATILIMGEMAGSETAAGWAQVARAAADRRRVLGAGPGVYYGDADLRESARAHARARLRAVLRAGLAAGTPVGEIVDALLAGDPSLDHVDALELLEDACAAGSGCDELFSDATRRLLGLGE